MTEDYWTWHVRILCAFCAATVFGTAVAMLMGLVDDTALEWPGFVVFLGLIAFGVWRGLTVKVTADSKRIVVRNVLATHVVRRADVLRVKKKDVEARGGHVGKVPALYVRGRTRPIKMTAMLALADRRDDRFESALKRWGSR